MLNIPKYRAKKIDSDEYVVGYLKPVLHNQQDQWIIQEEDFWDDVFVDPSTLSINFPDMKDSENNPIFASLSEDGKGGDLIKEENSFGTVVINKQRAYIHWSKCPDFFSQDLCNHHKYCRIIGIQK